jgi:hypothetical protein
MQIETINTKIASAVCWHIPLVSGHCAVLPAPDQKIKKRKQPSWAVIAFIYKFSIQIHKHH